MYQLVFEYLYLGFVKREVGKGLMHAGPKRFTEGVSSINCSCGVQMAPARPGYMKPIGGEAQTGALFLCRAGSDKGITKL